MIAMGATGPIHDLMGWQAAFYIFGCMVLPSFSRHTDFVNSDLLHAGVRLDDILDDLLREQASPVEPLLSNGHWRAQEDLPLQSQQRLGYASLEEPYARFP